MTLRIRCSALGQIMSAPTAAASKAGEILSVGAKTFVRKMVREDIYGARKIIDMRYMQKGTRCEGEAILLYNSVYGTGHVKNTERRTSDFITGECDVSSDGTLDLKCSWSIDTFPICELDAKDSDYEWQGRGYMMLWDKPRHRVAYCLIDTPDDLIGYEQPDLHKVSHIDDRFRITVVDYERDAEKEALIVAKVLAAREYYANIIEQFDAQHK